MGKESQTEKNKMVIIRRYEPTTPDDLRERLRLVYDQWMAVPYNDREDVHAKKVTDEESRSDNTRFNGKAARRN